MMTDQNGQVCLFNEGCQCENRNCGNCGWNPEVSTRRLNRFLNSEGIFRDVPQIRPIDAAALERRIRNSVKPLLDAGVSPQRVLVEVMRCIAVAEPVQSRWFCASSQLPDLFEDFWENLGGSRECYKISNWVLGVDTDGEYHKVKYKSNPEFSCWADEAGTICDIWYWMHLPERPKEGR